MFVAFLYSLSIDSYRSFIYRFTVLNNMFLTAARHKVNNLESSVVVQELELAINLALYGFMEFR